jgi:hypothetical protein
VQSPGEISPQLSIRVSPSLHLKLQLETFYSEIKKGSIEYMSILGASITKLGTIRLLVVKE